MRAAGCQGEHVFSKPAIKLIALASQGLTRRINILCDKSLLAAFADDEQTVQLKHARAAVKDSAFRRYSRATDKWWLVAGGLAAGLAIGIASRFMSLPLGPGDPSHVGSTKTAPGSRTITSPLHSATATPADTVEASPAPGQPNPSNDPSGASAHRSFNAEISNRHSGSHEERRREVGVAATEAESHLAKRAGQMNGSPDEATAPPLRPAPPLWEGQSKLAAARIAATHLWLQQTPADRYSIQLLTAVDSDTQWIERFLHRATELVKEEELYVYGWKVNGRPVYRVAYGTFETIQQSMTAIVNLPDPLREYKPYPETVATMRQMGTQQ
jgi:MSHA biogenesis protein MshM